MEPVKVLFIDGEMICGGTENFLMNMFRNIDPTMVHIDFLVHYSQERFYDDEILRSGGTIYRLTVREDNDFIKYIKDLNRFFKEHPEYKIIHGNFESFGALYNIIAKKNGVKIRIAHSHIAHRLPGMKGLIKSIMNIPLKYTATDRLACSEVAGKYLFGKMPFTVFYNPLDIDKFKFDKKKRIKARKGLGVTDQFIIGHVGRFDLQKNHKFLLNVFDGVYRKNDKAMLVLCGTGPLEQEIKDLAKNKRIDDRILFLGSRKDMNELYQAMDLFVLPSLFEGLPISGTEAQTAGLKCLFSDTITCETKITENAEFLPIDKEVNWVNAILEIIQKGYEREDLSEAIRFAGFDIGAQAEKLQKFYIQKYNEIYGR